MTPPPAPAGNITSAPQTVSRAAISPSRLRKLPELRRKCRRENPPAKWRRSESARDTAKIWP